MIIPTSVSNIGYNAFNGNGLSTVSIFLTVVHPGCSSLSTVIIPTSVSNIGKNAFQSTFIMGFSCNKLNRYSLGCSSLSTVAIPTSVSKIGDYAFQGTIIVEIMAFLCANTFIMAIHLGCSNLETVVIPTSVSSIENYSFQGSHLKVLSTV